MMTLECRMTLLLTLAAFLCTTVLGDQIRRVADEVRGAQAGREPAHLPFPKVPEVQVHQQPDPKGKASLGARQNQQQLNNQQQLQDNQQGNQQLNQQPVPQKVHVLNEDQNKQQPGQGLDVNAAPQPANQVQGARELSRSHARQQAQMDALNHKREEERQAALQAAFQQQEQLRQQQQERVRQQQEAIRKQVEQQKQYQQQLHQQVLQQQQGQQRQQAGVVSSNNNNNNNNNDLGGISNNNLNSDINAHKQNPPVEPPKKSDVVAPTPRPQQEGVGGAGSVVGNVPSGNDQDRSGLIKKEYPNNNNDNDNVQNNRQGDVPDAPHEPVNSNNNNNNNNGLSDEFRRGLIKKVQGEQESNLNNIPMQRNAFPPEQPVREIGGMHINWDWDDFSITFQNYGAAEMKVRRAPHATTGEPWPLPQYYTKKDKNILVVDSNFQFVISSNITCDIIDQAVERYRRRIVESAMEDMYDNLQNAEGTNLEPPETKYQSVMYQQAPIIAKISLKVRKPCSVFPSLDSDESYDLVVKKTSAYLWANEVWGLLRGLETLSQLIWRGPNDKLYIKESVISDYPRFPHRGILVDSSRHFIFKEVIFEMMDAMEMNKMNVLHWHIVDDQSFPYESQVFPELSAKGAYHPTFVYSLKDIADMIEYGRMRGIRILPEFDSPGHTYSWGLSRPELLTQCYSGSSPVKGYLGPIDPIHNSTYRFLKTLFGEILHVFKDEYMHLGGDEVPLGCWQSNPDVTKFGEKLSQQSGQSQSDQVYFGGPSPNIRLVYEYYVNRVMKDIKELGKKRHGIKFIMWQEVMNNDLKLPNDTLIQVWMGDMADVSRAISMGYNVLYSSCWYLDHVEYGVKWPKYYQCDPADTSYGYNIDEKKVKGGEACLWSEYIDNENLIQTTWPRASAVAERLWSSKDTRNLDTAGERLSEHRCRMLRRGLSVGQVSGPDYCLKRGVKRGPRKGPDCQGEGCRAASAASQAPVEDPEINFRLRTETGRSSDCTWLFQVGGNVTLLAIVAVIAFVVLVSISRSSGKLYTLRTCRHRTILIVFLTVLVVYFMCYTTMWMHVFEFSGSLHKRRHSAESSSSSA